MQAGSLRESIIANLNEPYLASRLRELAHLNGDELLDQAIMLHGCQTAPKTSINTIAPEEADTITTAQRLDNLALRIDQLS